MPSMETISSRHNPLVRMFRELARDAHDDQLLLEGARIIQEALDAGVTLRVASVSARLLASPDAGISGLTEALARSGTRVVRVSAAVMAAVSPVRTPSGIVAIGERPAPKLHDVYAGPRPLAVILTGLQDPGNVGAIVRAAGAAGASGLVTCERTANPYGWKALRGAMGVTFRMPVVAGQPVALAVATARRHGLHVLAATPRGGQLLFDVDLTRPLAVLFGGEGAGLDDEASRLADEHISIPMAGSVESLNVAVSAALVAYEAYRQRRSSVLVEGRRS